MNKNIWNLYKESERGRNAISIFNFNGINEDDLEDRVKAVIDFNKKYLGGAKVDNILYRFYWIFDNIVVDNLYTKENESATEYFERLIDTIEVSYLDAGTDGEPFKREDKKPYIKKKDYKKLGSIITELSLTLYFLYPGRFYPIMFPEQFDVLINAFDVLRIPMPDLPASNDKRGRLLFYEKLCEQLYYFAEENDLTPQECCACIYDFAFVLREDDEPDTELPEPTNIWLTGGSKEDYESFLKKPIKGKKSVWTCNENTKRGDIIVMYVRYPHSCIQSVWRADIDGVYTPFNYYNSRTRVTDGILVPKVKISELKEDPYFSQLPITRKNFQGVNGVRLTAKDYSELQRLFKAKGFDNSSLPQLYHPDLTFDQNFKYEKDVEEKLLIPLLYKLGYTETDWSRELYQKAGRKEKAIPDFVFLPKGEVYFQNSPMVIEAKYDMSSNMERTKAYNQALSYARIMKSPIFGICDKERLILFKEKNNTFDRYKPIFEKHWQSINDVETFRKLKQLIGKESISSIR